MDIIEFLKARLDEDERAARFAFADHNDAGPEWTEVRSGAVSVGDHEDELVTFDAGISRHIVRHDPARVLREIKAKREIIKICVGQGYVEDGPMSWRTSPPEAPVTWFTLAELAAVYADHPDYQQEWAP